MATGRTVLTGLVMTVVLVGCGNRLPHDEIVAAHEAQGASSTQPSDTPALGSDAGIVGGDDPAVSGGPVGSIGSGSGGSPSASPGGQPATGSAPGKTPAGGGSAGAAGSGATPAHAAGPAKGTTVPTGGAAGGGSAPAALAPIRVGNVGGYSGVLGSIFGGGRTMIQVWAKDVNARGGLAGHPVRLFVVDDAGDPARNLSVVKDLVENQGVIAFVGNLVPLSLDGSVKYLESKGVPVVGGDLVAANWWSSPVLFPHGTHVDSAAVGSVALTVKSGKTKFGLVSCTEAAACGAAARAIESGAQRAGATVVYKATISLAQPDFTAECLQAQSAGATAMFVAADGHTIGRMANSCAQQGYRPQFTSSQLALVNSLAANPNLDKVVAAQSTFPWMAADTPAAQAYQAAVAQYAPTLEPAGATSTIWAAGELFEVAVRRAALGANPTSAEILGGLRGIKDETLGGLVPPLTFSTERPAKIACYFTIAINGGKWVAPNGSNLTCP